MDNKSENVIIKNNQVYETFENDFYLASRKSCSLFEWVKERFDVRALGQNEEIFAWKAAKIPFNIWEEIVLFHLSCYEIKDDESHSRLWFNPQTSQWRHYPLPFYGKGLKVDEISDHENTSKIRALFPDPWISFGTIHTHCNAPAGQSSVDKADEETAGEGLHITLGDLKDITDLSLCIRFYTTDGILNFDRPEIFFQLPDWLENIPENYRRSFQWTLFRNASPFLEHLNTDKQLRNLIETQVEQTLIKKDPTQKKHTIQSSSGHCPSSAKPKKNYNRTGMYYQGYGSEW